MSTSRDAMQDRGFKSQPITALQDAGHQAAGAPPGPSQWLCRSCGNGILRSKG